MKFIATCKLGLESTVTRQLHDLNIEVLETSDARVTFSGGQAELAKSLFWLRTAERVLLVVEEFDAETFDELFEHTKAVRWNEYLKPHTNIHVTGKSAKSTLFSVSDCQSIVKKAIVESLKSSYRTTVIPEGGDEIIVEVGILRNRVSLCLDSCGAGLSRRGYRTYNVSAPLSETLGAAIVLLSRYRSGMTLIDPMCGSGTMPIEAAMIAQNIAPGLNRSFAAEGWWFLDQGVWAQERKIAADARVDQKIDVHGFDIDSRSIDLCKKHAKKAGVFCDWQVRDIKDFSVSEPGGVIVCNPPYGERLMDKNEAKAIYRTMRRVFSPYPGWSVNVFSGMREFETIYGKRADKRRKLTNGGMPCTLYQYFGVRNV